MSSFKFWRDSDPKVISETEYQEWQADTSARVVDFVIGICRRAASDCPPDTVDIQLPPDLMPELYEQRHYPHIAKNILAAIANQIPQYNPLPTDATDGQLRAWRVLDAIRKTVIAAGQAAPEDALQIIKAATGLGIDAARAHVEPYESKVAGKLKQEANLPDQLELVADAAERHALWQQAANEVWAKHPDWSARAVAMQLANNPSVSGDNFDTIRREIRKPGK